MANTPQYEVPQYRVRLFLSVDLTGSTAFKSQTSDVLQWSKLFQEFYNNFPLNLKQKYNEVSKNIGDNRLTQSEKTNGFPKLWKTIGDEILFCCTLTSRVQLNVCMLAFIDSLKEYGHNLYSQKFKINTKGNAWIASFPTPNCLIKPNMLLSNEKTTFDTQIITEKMEKEADEKPSDFDFLGKGIDAGFRIARNSSIDALTISPGLGYLLLEPNGLGIPEESRQIEINFLEKQSFKGVAQDKPYPVLFIDTTRNNEEIELLKLEKKLIFSQQTLNHSEANKNLKNYLKKYIECHEIELPYLRELSSDAPPENPTYYNDFCASWKELEEKQNKPTDIEKELGSKAEQEKGNDDFKDLLSSIQDFIINLGAVLDK